MLPTSIYLPECHFFTRKKGYLYLDILPKSVGGMLRFIHVIERESIVKVRVNQYFFRKTILAAYNNTCCITGINKPELLIASHIIPWSENEELSVNPLNGLCLNAIHDKAFDCGLIAIRTDLMIILCYYLLI